MPTVHYPRTAEAYIMLIKTCGSFEWFGRCYGRSVDLESAGVYPPIVIHLPRERLSAKRSAFALSRRIFSTATRIGLGTSANKFTAARAVNEVNSVSCRARSITYRTQWAERGRDIASRSRGSDVAIIILLTVRANSPNWYRGDEVSAGFRTQLLYSTYVSH